VNRLEEPTTPVASGPPREAVAETRGSRQITSPSPGLEFFNGLGGFTADGREYVTMLTDGVWTPAPWVNVIANPHFGFQVSTTGSGYTWSVNSRENQITPWSNDAVADSPGEVLHLRDEETGAVWSPTALPLRDAAPYTVKHGQGYSRFEHTAQGISLELVQFVAPEDPIKISRLKMRNLTARVRRLSVSAYVEWVLGALRAASAPYIVTEIDQSSGAMLARNPWSIDYGSRVAFADLAGRQTAWTGDRTEFLGRNGALDAPAALINGTPLSNRVGAGFDPCSVLQTQVRLEPNGDSEIVFFLGETASRAESLALVERYRTIDLDMVMRAVIRQWDEILGAIEIKTPDRSMDIMMNRWLLYQTLSCRVWARSAFYQAGGAYGFRDQLQDVMALTTSKPSITRAHLLRAAAQQFPEGDVQHWWLPPTGKGVRTRISDDRGWLAYVTARYVESSGDAAVLDETITFLEGPALIAGQPESYFQPTIAGERASLFEHCARALDASLATGIHELPLIGTGDWNDGMTRVGELGRGESVWLGWFLYRTLNDFAELAERRGEVARAGNWRNHTVILKAALERDGWDGEWYRRGYFDDGSPLGSASNSECRIDSIAQSWAVISRGGDALHCAAAMASMEHYLLKRQERLALIFTPPFDRGPLDPGYIKGYPPGIRENGGQYTHAALWSVIAWAMMGEGDKAGELFSMLNPINHASTVADIDRYKVEPYVVCADIYAVAPHVGRGGWTWYTGSAGWMYRAGLESILGFHLRGATLEIDPCIPKAWPRFEMVFRYHAARYEIAIENPRGVSRGVSRVTLDGEGLAAGAGIPLSESGTHRVSVTLG
jgi:cyclic beta-1,2-glucan synthetase